MSSPITTHVLDTTRGMPAVGVPVTLEFEAAPGTWNLLGQGKTDGDGRIRDLLPAETALGDGTTIYLPTVVAQFHDSEDNFRLFKVLAAHGAGQIEFGTYDRSTTPLRAAFYEIDERFRDSRARKRGEKAPMPRDLGYSTVLSLFPDPLFAQRHECRLDLVDGPIDEIRRRPFRRDRRNDDDAPVFRRRQLLRKRHEE